MDSIFKKKPLDPRLATFSSQMTPQNGAIGQNADGSFIYAKPVTQTTPTVQTPAPLSAIDKVAQTLNSQTDSIKKYYEAKLLKDEQKKNQQILAAQNDIKSAEESQKAGIQDLEGQTNNLIAEEEQSMGQEQRQQARTAQDTRKRLQNQFAALGTLEGSQYGQVAYDAEQDLANKQANTRATSGRTISGYKLSLNDAKRNFISTVSKEKAALQARISEIENNFEKGSEDYNKAIRDVVFSAQNKINDANLQVETARQIEEIKNTGTNSNVTKIAPKDLNIAKEGISNIGSMRSILVSNPKIATQLNPLDPSKRNFEFLKSQIADQVGRLRSGGAINADEEKRFLGFLPAYFDTPENIEYKLSTLQREFEGLAGSNISSPQGVSSDPLGIL